jgi:hypothetical protein
MLNGPSQKDIPVFETYLKIANGKRRKGER